MSPWLTRGRWFIRTNGKNGVPSWATREECEAAIAIRLAATPPERVDLTAWAGDEYLAAFEQQLPQLVTRSALDAWLADHRTRSARAKLRAYPILHARAEALIEGARAWAVDDAVPDQPTPEEHHRP